MVLALLPGLVALGCWQLGRAEEKRALLATYAERRIEAPITTAQLASSDDNAFRRVHLYGRFDAEHSVLLDNRMRDGQAGVELLQPFHDQASGQWLLINRGWLPWPDRRVPVHFDTPAHAWHWTLRCMYRRAARSSCIPTLKAANGRTCSLPLMPRSYGRRWAVKALPMSCAWSPARRLSPGLAGCRHGPGKTPGYAVQWFALAGALVLLYLYFGWHHNKEKRHGHRHSTGRA